MLLFPGLQRNLGLEKGAIQVKHHCITMTKGLLNVIETLFDKEDFISNYLFILVLSVNFFLTKVFKHIF